MQNNMVLVDSRNIPYGEIITVPVPTKDIAAAAGTEARPKTSWQMKHAGGRGPGNSKSVI